MLFEDVIAPVIVPANQRAEISIPLSRLTRRAQLNAQCSSMETGTRAAIKAKADRRGGVRLAHTFEGEQEHDIRIPAVGSAGKPALAFRVYSLHPDLLARFPLKGDMHIHSNRSDGMEPPPLVAACCRQIGLDFMAVTDHGKYEPSLEALSAFGSCPHDLLVAAGEEVHAPQSPVHFINFGGAKGVNRMFASRTYSTETSCLAGRLAASLPPGVDAGHAASSLWTCRRIRQIGGLSIYCHPFWITNHAYNVPASLNAWLFDTMPFDAFETIGGFHPRERESNQLQIALCHERRLSGSLLPIVGCSDAHGCKTGRLFGWYYTVVFSASIRLEDIISSIRAGYSVAVEAVPGEQPRVVGPFRLVKYALFLLREVFPLHDSLCIEEGCLMRLYAEGNRNAANKLDALRGRCDHLSRRLRGM